MITKKLVLTFCFISFCAQAIPQLSYDIRPTDVAPFLHFPYEGFDYRTLYRTTEACPETVANTPVRVHPSMGILLSGGPMRSTGQLKVACQGGEYWTTTSWEQFFTLPVLFSEAGWQLSERRAYQVYEKSDVALLFGLSSLRRRYGSSDSPAISNALKIRFQKALTEADATEEDFNLAVERVTKYLSKNRETDPDRILLKKVIILISRQSGDNLVQAAVMDALQERELRKRSKVPNLTSAWPNYLPAKRTRVAIGLLQGGRPSRVPLDIELIYYVRLWQEGLAWLDPAGDHQTKGAGSSGESLVIALPGGTAPPKENQESFAPNYRVPINAGLPDRIRMIRQQLLPEFLQGRAARFAGKKIIVTAGAEDDILPFEMARRLLIDAGATQVSLVTSK